MCRTPLIIVPCSGTKTLLASPVLYAGDLRRGSLFDVANRWLDRVEHANVPTRLARDLYAGRGFRFARQAADLAHANLCVISAGLGFVPGDWMVPGYEATVSGAGGSYVPAKVTDGFDPARWWAAVNRGKYAASMVHAMEASRGPILMALTKPYAQMVAKDLNLLCPNTLDRLTIFGRGLAKHLPPAVAARVVPYSPGVDAERPGTMMDYPQRALLLAAPSL